MCHTIVDNLGCQPSGSFKGRCIALCSERKLGLFHRTALNECVLYETPCRNGGVCIGHTGGYTCKCVGNFQGTYCDEEGMNHKLITVTDIKLLFLQY